MNLKIEDVLSKAVLSINNISDTPRLDAEIILALVLRLSRFDLFTRRHEFINEIDILKFEELVKRRMNSEPVAYITGEKAFFEDVFKVDKRVLIPRPETEFLVMKAIDYLKKYKNRPSVLDICTGSGCAGLSILRVVDCDITLSDISNDALDVVKINARRLFPENESIKIINSDLFQNIEEKYDVITANPPYLSENDMKNFVKGSLEFEPVSAFYGGRLGIELTRKIIRDAKDFLKSDGLLMIELGYEGSAFIKDQKEMKLIELVKDYNGIDRVAVLSPYK
ncbi:MAG TPA: peptide chain release factor N(5)-glutamine methyltransferase [bacterium]|nr:peptide chain release factor N(5)-glutamine methyltransferase [bacterium]